MYKAVIFDLDGTLLNTIDDLADAGNHVLKQLEFSQRTVNEYKQMVGNGVPKLVERMLPETARGGATQKMALQMFLNYYGMHSADKTTPYDDIMPMLGTLRKAGLQLGVLSNKEDNLTQNIVRHFFPNQFHQVCGHVIGKETKPDPTQILNMCKAMNLTNEEVLYVGDSEVDVQTARNAKIISCGVLWGYRTEEQLRAENVGLVVKTPRALCEFVLGCD